MQKIRQGDYFQTFFVFEKTFYKVKASDLLLGFNIFG